ncbi:galactokinase [Candidatus Parcubacteria bacterium]|jgi:NDP-sugar pyrophosphorylase family protein|nr:MAG: galactokinase [Candidatus Parcubacteria bacterium]
MTFPLNISVAILVGGLGTRLKPVVNDRPKVMALINGRPFLSYILDQINNARLTDVILCVGYMGKYLESEMGQTYRNLSLRYSYEYEPLGTGGALRNAHDLINSDTILIMNGDSYCQYNLGEYWSFHEQNNAFASILSTFVSDTSRYGRIRINDHNHVLAFEEKGSFTGPGWINAGIYLIDRETISGIPGKRFVSLEKEIFPSLIGKELYGFMNDGLFLDIGTPDDFAKAGAFFKQI